MNTKSKITPEGRADALLHESLGLLVMDLAASLATHGVALTPEQGAELESNLGTVVQTAQGVILARLKTKAYEIRESYRNSGADSTVDADVWDDAVQAADPSGYDVMWMREWEA